MHATPAAEEAESRLEAEYAVLDAALTQTEATSPPEKAPAQESTHEAQAE